MTKIIKLISIILITTILIPLLPIGELKVNAFDQEMFKVDEVTLIRNYDKNQNSVSAIVSIRGQYLKDATVRIFTNDGGFKNLPNSSRDINDDNVLQYRLSPEDIGASLYVGNKEIKLNEENMPNITSITTRKVEEERELRLQGTNLNQLQYGLGNIKVYLDREGETEITNDITVNGNEALVANTKAKTLGLQNIVFKKSGIQTINYNPTNPMVNVAVNMIYTYQDQFLLYKPIEVNELVMRPNRGIPKDIVYFEAPVRGTDTDLDEYDVFFVKATDGTDSYRINNKGQNRIFQSKVKKDNIDYNILTVTVPDRLPIGEYYVVLTNVVPTGKDPMKEVSREMILEQRFRVIDGEKKSRISLIDPKEGPDTGGTSVEIMGKFFGSLNIDEFTPTSTAEPTIDTPIDELDPKTLTLSYDGGIYGDSQNPIQIDRVERKIKVIMGVEAVFIENEHGDLGTFSPANDILRVRTGQVTNPGLKKVMVEITTIFHKNGGGTIQIIEIADNANYTYIPGQIAPEITSVVPELIQVIRSGNSYVIPEDRQIAIHGKNLMIHKYIDDNKDENLIYPIIRIGDIILNKNINPNINLKVLNSNGKVLDGTKGNELGSKILVELPLGTTVGELGKKDLRVTNPTRNSTTPGLYDNKEDYIEFVMPGEDLNPIIHLVKPYTSPLEGGELITVEGSNFRPLLKVFIDGEEIKQVNRDEQGKKLTFTSPKGREGQTQLQIMNEEGGMATHPFIYVKTFSDPKIIDFAPKRGNTGTLVMIKGNFFIKPEPISTSENIFKVIGSRVLLDGEEINQYNRNPNNKNLIELKPFSPNKPLFNVVEKRIELADYYDGIMLRDEQGRDYIIDQKPNGEIQLTDGALNTYTISLDINKNIIAQSGEDNRVVVENNKIKIINNLNEEKNLRYLTPYTTSGSTIIGKKVKVIDNSTIYFTVPILPDEKYYDLTVVNPDTKKDEKLGKSGFYYLIQPGLKPEIHSISPEEGSVEGGYAIDIIGKGFPRVSDSKPKVFINGVEVGDKNIEVSPDGRGIRVLSVPKYDGDLIEDKGTSRWGVPVVILNPDGSTASKEKGFFYVVPSSKPNIKRIDPNTGTAAGGTLVKIIGEQFRYYEPYDDINRNGQLDEDQGETYNDLNNNGRWDDLNDEDYRNTVEWEQAARKTPLEHDQYDYYYDSNILPRVFFGNTEAKIVEFEEGYLEAISPKNIGGKVDIYILNNDGGISNKVPFNYSITPVTITSMVPNMGPKEGGTPSTIEGSGFSPTEIEIYKDIYLGGKSEIEKKTMPIVRFGNITNERIAWDKENGGGISANKAKVNLSGGLTVDYNGENKSLTLTITENKVKYTKTIQGYDNNIKYIPVNLLKADGIPYEGKELIKVNVEGTRIAEDKIVNGRLVVERGYAPATTFINTKEIRVDNTPSYYTVEKNVPVFVINNEGGRGNTVFEYKNPDSNPRIINIRADSREPNGETIPELDASSDVLILKVNYKGSSIIAVEGTDFRPKAKIQMGSLILVSGNDITLDGSTRITFRMPILPEAAVGSRLPLLVQNDDGGSHSSDQRIPKIFIEITKGETNPEITDITPTIGPSIGGTKVKISGTDIRNTIKGFEDNKLRVFFGEVEAPSRDISWNAIDRTVEVIAPKSEKLGIVEVKVDNPDGERTQDGILFEYISKPAITNISPNKLFSNDDKTVVTIIGQQFLNGAKVIVGGKIVEKADIRDGMNILGQGIIGVGINGINREIAIVGGIEAATTTVENDKVIKITFPESKGLANSDIIIINPDGGISDIYNKFKYEKPIPSRPLVLEGIPGYESTVQLIWSKSDENILNKATDYEIYGRKTKDKDDIFIGNTKSTEFLVRSLEAGTQYTFKVRALNQHGAALDFATVTVKTLSIKEDEKLKEKTDKLEKEEKEEKLNGKEVIQDGRMNIYLGTNAFRASAASIDLRLSKYKNQNNFTIAIPLELARKDNRLTIKDDTMTTVINARDLYTLQVSRLDKGNTDAYLRIHIDKSTGSHLPKGRRPASKAYELYFDYIYGKDKVEISQLLRSSKLYLEQNTLAYPNNKDSKIYLFNEETGEYNGQNSTSIDIKGRSKAILLSLP